MSPARHALNAVAELVIPSRVGPAVFAALAPREADAIREIRSALAGLDTVATEPAGFAAQPKAPAGPTQARIDQIIKMGWGEHMLKAIDDAKARAGAGTPVVSDPKVWKYLDQMRIPYRKG